MMEIEKIDDRYDVIKTVGKGMSGQVLLVSDTHGEKALKFLNPLQMNVSRDEALRNFKNEFSILKELNHPNIAQISDFGYDDKKRKYYFTSEFVGGMEFHKACDGQPFAVIEKLIVQVLRALNYLHSRGIYHFDIKPQNILVSTHGDADSQAKLIDFGLAGFTSPNQKVGTPAYMAPEVIQGGVLDGRTDLYSFGVMVYKILTGTNPFVGKTLKETLANQLAVKPQAPSTLNPDLPKYWDSILERMLEKKPVDRYSQASLIIRDLNFLSNKKFEIETQDSKLSYLPERGALIGRDTQWASFMQIFQATFLADQRPDKKVFIVQGKKGTGKTRLISEIKYYSQLQNIPVRTLAEYQTQLREPDRFVLIVDQYGIDADAVNALMQETLDKACLIIWATEDAPSNWTGCVTVRLDHYSTLELKQYLESVTGLTQTPDRLIAEIYNRTQGNPLFVTEFIKSLLAQDLLYDASGKWDAKTFEDIQIDFDRIHIPSSVEDYLHEKFTNLSTVSREILKWLAVNNASLTQAQLETLTHSAQLDTVLLALLGEEILEKTSVDDAYFFKNLLMIKVVQRYLTKINLVECHQKLAAVFESDDENRERFLYHVGFSGQQKKSIQALAELGSRHMAESEFAKAIVLYERLLFLTAEEKVFQRQSVEAHLQLSKAYLLNHDYDNAESSYNLLLTKIIHKPRFAEAILTIYQNLIDLAFKQSDLGESEKHLQQVETYHAAALVLVPKSPQAKIWELIFKNYHAYLFLKRDDTDAALDLYLHTYTQWKSNLDEKEKQQVTNNRLVDIYLMKRQYDLAVAICLESITILEKLKDKYVLALHCYALGGIYYQIIMNEKRDDMHELVKKCITNFQRCEKLAREIKNFSLMLRAFSGIGMLYLNQEQPQKGLDYYLRALVVSRKSGELETAGFISYNIATIYKGFNNPREAYSYIIYAVNTFESLPKKSAYIEFILFMSYLVLAEIYLQKHEVDKAIAAAEQANFLFEKCDMAKNYECKRSLVWAQIHFEQKDYSQGEHYLTLAQSQAHSPEQKLIIEKYLQSPEFKALSHALEIPNIANLSVSTTLSLPQDKNPADDYKAVIDLLRSFNKGDSTHRIFSNVLQCGMRLVQAKEAYLLELCRDSHFEIVPTLSAPYKSNTIYPEEALHEAIVQKRAVCDWPFDKNGDSDALTFFPVSFGNRVLVFYFVHDTKIAESIEAHSTHQYLIPAIMEQLQTVLKDKTQALAEHATPDAQKSHK